MDPPVLAPFRFDVFSFRDVRTITERLQMGATAAIRNGFHIMPDEFKCEFIDKDPDGTFPIIRLAVFNARDQLVGAFWLGCNTTERGHTDRAARVFTRPAPGPILRHEREFWRPDFMVALMKHLLQTPLATRAGGTVHFVGFDYVRDVRVVPIGLATIHGDVDARLVADSDVTKRADPLPSGAFDVRIQKRPDVTGRP